MNEDWGGCQVHTLQGVTYRLHIALVPSYGLYFGLIWQYLHGNYPPGAVLDAGMAERARVGGRFWRVQGVGLQGFDLRLQGSSSVNILQAAATKYGFAFATRLG